MAPTLHPPYCADRAVQITSQVQQLERLASDTYRIRIPAPAIARQILPGQFVMLRLAGTSDPLIGRALAMYDVYADASGTAAGVDVVFIVKGKLTTALVAAGTGAGVTLWGPLGNAFSTRPVETLVIAVGGVGQTPMLALAAEALGQRTFGSERAASDANSDAAPQSQRPCGYASRVVMVYGARTADRLASVEAFRSTGMDLRLCTDDGSVGHHGRVPDVVADVLGELDTAEQGRGQVRVVCCGPEVMMARVAQIAATRRVPCEVSLETPMACGIGVCFTCVARVRQQDGSWDYKRTCVEGPIFDAEQIVWE